MDGNSFIALGLLPTSTTEDQFGVIYSMKRSLAHEFGHYLGLSLKNSDFDYHDGGPYPNGTIALMKAGDPGRWMRHEDWRKANEQAKAKMQ